MHAVIYLIFSYFGTAMLFYLFGAPLLAALEVIIYAGAIMVLFLFVLMMIRMESYQEVMFPLWQWLPAAAFGRIYLVAGFRSWFSELREQRSACDLVLATPRDLRCMSSRNTGCPSRSSPCCCWSRSSAPCTWEREKRKTRLEEEA